MKNEVKRDPRRWTRGKKNALTGRGIDAAERKRMRENFIRIERERHEQRFASEMRLYGFDPLVRFPWLRRT